MFNAFLNNSERRKTHFTSSQVQSNRRISYIDYTNKFSYGNFKPSRSLCPDPVTSDKLKEIRLQTISNPKLQRQQESIKNLIFNKINSIRQYTEENSEDQLGWSFNLDNHKRLSNAKISDCLSRKRNSAEVNSSYDVLLMQENVIV